MSSEAQSWTPEQWNEFQHEVMTMMWRYRQVPQQPAAPYQAQPYYPQPQYQVQQPVIQQPFQQPVVQQPFQQPIFQ